MAGVEWLIFYADGTTYSNLDGAWESAPGWGAIAVVYRDSRVGWAICHGGDYIRLVGGDTPISIDRDGLLDFVVNELGAIKVGRMLSRTEYEKVYQRAKRVMGELRKTGHVQHERRAGG